MPVARSEGRRRLVSRSFTGVHSGREIATRRKLRGFWRSVSASVMQRVEAQTHPGFTVEEIFQPAEWRKPFNRLMVPQWRASMIAGIQFEADIVKAGQDDSDQRYTAIVQAALRCGLIVQADDAPSIQVEMSPQMQRDVAAFLNEREVAIWAKVGATTKHLLAEVIAESLKQGEKLDDITRRIRRVLTSYSDYESTRVARTEVTAAMNSGQQSLRDEWDIEAKEWISTRDSHTRAAHLAAGGQIVANNSSFVVGGERMDFPGDGSHGASASNIVHCRCSAVAAIELGKGRGKPPTPPKPASAPPPPDPDAARDQQAVKAFEAERKQAAPLIDKFHAAMQGAEDLTHVQAKVARMKSYDEAIADLRNAMASANSAYETLRKAQDAGDNTKVRSALAAYQKALKQAEKANAALDSHKEKTRTAMIRALGIPKADRAQFVWSYDPGVGAEVKATTQQARDFLQSTLSSKLFPADTSVGIHQLSPTEDQRAYYEMRKIFLSAVPERNQVSFVVHEFGHFLETHPKVNELCKGFLYHRIGNETPLVLRKVFDPNYKPGEVGAPDDFGKVFGSRERAAYAGKWYAGATELLSMGVEQLYNDPVAFARNDPEYFRFVVGILKGNFL